MIFNVKHAFCSVSMLHGILKHIPHSAEYTLGSGSPLIILSVQCADVELMMRADQTAVIGYVKISQVLGELPGSVML